MSKRDRDLIRQVEALGYGYDRTNSKGVRFWIHEDTGAELKVPGSVNENVARSVLDEARHQIGLPTKGNKRRPDLIRQRHEAERALERARAAAHHLAGNTSVREAEEALRAAERRWRYWDRMVREATGALA